MSEPQAGPSGMPDVERPALHLLLWGLSALCVIGGVRDPAWLPTLLPTFALSLVGLAVLKGPRR